MSKLRSRVFRLAVFSAVTTAGACQLFIDPDPPSAAPGSDGGSRDSAPDAPDTPTDANPSDGSLDALDGGGGAFCHGQAVCFTFDEPGLTLGPDIAFDDAGVDGSRCIVATTNYGPALFLKQDGLTSAGHTHMTLECQTRLDDIPETVDGALYAAGADICTVTNNVTGLVATIVAQRGPSSGPSPFQLLASVYVPFETLCQSEPLNVTSGWTRAAIDLDWSDASTGEIRLQLGSTITKLCSVPADKIARVTTTIIGIDQAAWVAAGPPFFKVGLDNFAVDLR